MTAIITNPVNTPSQLPLRCSHEGLLQPQEALLGVTTLDVVRSQTFIGEIVMLTCDLVRQNLRLCTVCCCYMRVSSQRLYHRSGKAFNSAANTTRIHDCISSHHHAASCAALRIRCVSGAALRVQTGMVDHLPCQ
jgi:malate/lactate dehydrogenase